MARMSGDCYFCHGLVLPSEADDILLANHGDHEVYMHRRCAVGHGVYEADESGSGEGITVVCPECGAAETR